MPADPRPHRGIGSVTLPPGTSWGPARGEPTGTLLLRHGQTLDVRREAVLGPVRRAAHRGRPSAGRRRGQVPGRGGHRRDHHVPAAAHGTDGAGGGHRHRRPGGHRRRVPGDRLRRVGRPDVRRGAGAVAGRDGELDGRSAGRTARRGELHRRQRAGDRGAAPRAGRTGRPAGADSESCHADQDAGRGGACSPRHPPCTGCTWTSPRYPRSTGTPADRPCSGRSMPPATCPDQ